MTTTTIKALAVRRRAAAAALGFGVTKLDELISRGEIKAVKSGKHLLITTAELEAYLSRLPPATLKSPYRAARKV